MVRRQRRIRAPLFLLIAALVVAALLIVRVVRRASPARTVRTMQEKRAKERISGEERGELERVLRQKVKPGP